MTLRADLTDLFIDPISGERMADPLINTCGHSFEAEQINGWIAHRVNANAVPDCPLCRVPIGALVPNMLLKQGLEILDKPATYLADRLEDLTDEDREELEIVIEHVRKRRLANNEAGIAHRLAEAMTFAKGAIRATGRVYCPEKC
jgi:hypothetical protein